METSHAIEIAFKRKASHLKEKNPSEIGKANQLHQILLKERRMFGGESDQW